MIVISRPLRSPRSNDHGQAEVVLEVSEEPLLHAVVTGERGCAFGLLPDREAVGAGDALRISGRNQIAGPWSVAIRRW